MGTVLEMKSVRHLAWLFTVAVFGLTGCGNDPAANDTSDPIRLVGAALKAPLARPDGGAVDPAAFAMLRSALENCCRLSIRIAHDHSHPSIKKW